MNKFASFFILLFLIVISIPTFGQLKEAKKQMNLFNYSEAISILQKVIHKNAPKTINEATQLLAECYRKQNDMVNARTWYGKTLISGKTEPEELLLLWTGIACSR